MQKFFNLGSKGGDGASLVPADNMSDEEYDARCMTLKLSITMIVFNYLRRGLFERDKLTISTLITLTLQEQDGMALEVVRAY